MFGLFGQIVALISSWNSLCLLWWNQWDPGKEFLGSIWYMTPGFAIPFFLFAAWELPSDSRKYWESLRMLVVVSALGASCGAAFSLFVVGPLPLWVLGGSYAAVLWGVYSALFYGKRLFSWAGVMARRVPDALRKAGVWVRRRILCRRLPVDYLAELDASAQDVDRRLEELLAQREKLAARAAELIANIELAHAFVGKVPKDSAARKIADDVLEKFQRRQADVSAGIKSLDSIAEQIKAGRSEMEGLISLARLCRQAGEADIFDDKQAIEAARKALDALRIAFEQADAVLSAAVIAIPDINLDLAFQHCDDSLRRSVALAAAAERIGAPLRERTQ